MTRSTRWERRPDDRPQELLEAAYHVFTTRGYRATRLEEVAEAAGVTKGTIYYYFRNKDDLLRQAIEQRRRQAFAQGRTLMERGSGPLADRLRAALRAAWLDLGGPQGAMVRLLLGEVSVEAPEVFRAWLEDVVVSDWRELAEVIRRGQATGEFRAEADADVAARMLAGGILMQTLLQHHGVDELAPIGVERLIDASLDLFFASLRPDAPPRAARAAAATPATAGRP